MDPADALAEKTQQKFAVHMEKTGRDVRALRCCFISPDSFYFNAYITIFGDDSFWRNVDFIDSVWFGDKRQDRQTE